MSARNRNYYELLGVPRDASREEIKRAYRDIALVYHPDSHYFDDILHQQLTEDQVEIFKLITAAYHTLINADSRREYDATLPEVKDWSEETCNPYDEKMVDAILHAGEGAARPKTFGVFGRVGKPSKAEINMAAQLHSINDMRRWSFRVKAAAESAIKTLRSLFGRK